MSAVPGPKTWAIQRRLRPPRQDEQDGQDGRTSAIKYIQQYSPHGNQQNTLWLKEVGDVAGMEPNSDGNSFSIGCRYCCCCY